MSAPPLLPASSSAAIDCHAEDLAPIVDQLRSLTTAENPQVPDLAAATEPLLRLRHTFIDDARPRVAKDAFRQMAGFQTILELTNQLAEMYDPNGMSDDERKGLLAIYKDALGTLAEALKTHLGNKRYFARKIAGGGMAALERSLATLTRKVGKFESDAQQLYGAILAAALCQETAATTFTAMSAKFRGKESVLSPQEVRSAVDQFMGSAETVEVSELLGSLVRVWAAESASTGSESEIMRLTFAACLGQLAAQSRRNVVALHATGMLTAILSILFRQGYSETERKLYQDLAHHLSVQGINNLEDAVALYRHAHDNYRNLEFLLSALKYSKEPPSIQFDLSLHGFCSVEFATLGRPFPPTSSAGYTLAAWVRFDEFDRNTHTTIFGTFDASQTCFVLAYIEKHTRKFIFQTSIRGSRPSVRFKSATFETNRWYHICIVHRRAKPAHSSRASLFVDGEFMEQLKIEFPTTPVSNNPHRPPRIQAFFGTPQDLAMRLGKGVSNSRWSLSNGLLLDEAYSDDLIAVFYNLGPRYFGNFQDCLGSFQTYKASATLNLRNEHLHPGREEESDIVTAIRRRASSLVPETTVVINLSPVAVLDSNDGGNVGESRLSKCLSKQAAKSLQHMTKAGGNALVVNGGTPAINDGLTLPQGVGVLTGEPVVAVPWSMDDASWCIGGCAAVHLSLVRAADSAQATRLAVEALYEAVQDNWRNSEAMERENGYGILAVLLREKLGFQIANPSSIGPSSAISVPAEEHNDLMLDLLRLTLRFVGYDFEHPDHSIIANPLAYRVLLVDMDIWRSGEGDVPDLYYSQFRTFVSDSNYRHFNAKRFGRMRVSKKLLETLKSNDLADESIRPCLGSFQALMESSLSPDLLRSLALSITFNLHRPRTPSALHKKRSLRFAGPSSPRPSSSSISPPTKVSGTTLAIEMLRLYASVLCNALDLNPLKRFAKAVTNKWLLYLSCEDEPEVVVLAVKILARLLIVHGSSYSKKFSDKNGGYTVLEKNLDKWWNVPVLWPICFSILFGQDLAAVDLDRPFTAADFLSVFLAEGDLRIAFPEMLPVIMNMLKHAAESLVSLDEPTGQDPVSSDVPKKILMSAQKSKLTSASEVLVEGTCIVHSIVAFLEGLFKESRNFRDFTIQSGYVQEILGLLWPTVVGVQPTHASFELHSRHGDFNFEESSFLTRPKSSRKNSSTPLQVSIIDSAENLDESADSPQRRSSFILVSSDKSKNQPSFARIQRVVSVSRPAEEYSRIHHLVKSIASLVLDVFEEQLLQRKDFSGLGLYHKTPAGNLEHQADFNSWLLSLFLSRLEGIPSTRPHLLHEARALTNIARFATHLTEAVYEGWFLNGAAVVLEFLGVILEYIQRPDVSHIKTIRLCSQSVATLHAMLYRITLFQLSEAHDSKTLSVLQRLSYWQVVLLAAAETQPRNLQLLCYLLYTRLISTDTQIRLAAASLWRMILVQKPQDMSNLLRHGSASLQRRLTDVFEALAGLDDEKFLREIDDERQDLDGFFLGVLSHHWESFVADENVKNEESARHRISKRKEKLKQWAQLEKYDEDVLRKHDATLPHWISNISASEFLKSQRFLQDLQDNSVFMWSAFSNLLLGLKRPGALLAEDKERNYKLDQTEGRSRMRLRVVPDESGERQDYQPKRKASEPPAPKLDLRLRALSAGEMASSPKATIAKTTTGEPRQQDDPSEETDDRSTIEDENFEMVDDPKLELEDYEDKNRRVMRSLHRGDQVQSVCNMSRIIGLEAVEGLLILGKDCIYILDNFFQRADGEIVNVWQAPPDERDPYVRMIAGRESNDRRSHEHETRSWKWADLVSVSKRRFLFRDVALEIFFTDGTSYLLTFFAAHVRDNLCTLLGNKAPQVTGSAGHSRPEDIWRFETLRSQEDAPQSLGSKFASVFGHLPANPATRKWVRGEISNFHYLMLINTLAGRTFNDLTQYPVFPWVLADYTSEELDLTNPKTFRDLSKPMGCQTPDREMGFRERFNAFAEMGDDNSPPFHYGTHYSSAMIVTSYLIRLQPFVKSYLLLQGGTFDHADRLFYSVRKTWESASRGNMTDVRELIPEFFYLPEFLINSNKYEFGMLQNMRTAIDSVELPPWAKGDPKIFIQKHREALESPYVSENLHHWIDLVFGCKQKGEAAIEAVNVFHHLSYKGAKDLDAISDPMERLATIGIIHNFGQTPGQIFHRAHPPREGQKYRVPRLDALAESLTQMPLSLLDIGEHVTALAMKQDRLLCTSALRINVPPAYDQYLEWGFFDGSVRFYSAEGRKLLGHFEHLHIGQLSYVTFADSRTLVTCGNDCTVSLWTVTATSRAVDLQPIGSLFGHRTPVTVLAVSRSFSTLLSASSDGQIMLWDLNRRGFVRTLPGDGVVDCAKVNDVTGDIIVCRGRRLTMYTLNGEMVIDQPVCDAPDDRVLSCSFYEGVQNEWLERELVLTGHARGVVNIWSKVIRHGAFELELIRQLHHTDSSRDNGANIQTGISCILALPQVVYTGDEAGRVYEWNCVQRR